MLSKVASIMKRTIFFFLGVELGGVHCPRSSVARCCFDHETNQKNSGHGRGGYITQAQCQCDLESNSEFFLGVGGGGYIAQCQEALPSLWLPTHLVSWEGGVTSLGNLQPTLVQLYPGRGGGGTSERLSAVCNFCSLPIDCISTSVA